MAGHVKCCVIGLATMWVASLSPVWAMGPNDPFVAPRIEQTSGLAGEAAASADGDAAAATGLSGVRLGRHAGAVIDGQWVRKGQAVRGARLVQIQRTRVTLKHPDGHEEIIDMFPPAGGKAGAAAAASTEAVKP